MEMSCSAAASLGWGQPTPQWQHIVSAGVSKSVITITNMIQIHKCVLRDFCPTIVCFNMTIDNIFGNCVYVIVISINVGLGPKLGWESRPCKTLFS